MFHFPTSHPLPKKKHQKFKGFLIVVGGRMERWLEMSYIRGNG